MRLQTMRVLSWAGALVMGPLVLAACGTNSAGSGQRSDGGTFGDGSGGGGHGGSGSGGQGGDGGGGGSGEGGRLHGNDGGGGGGGGDACATVNQQAKKIPLDLVFGIDTSFSMTFENKWTNLSAALDTFVAAPASSSLDLGMQFFPLRETCLVSAYQDLAVPLSKQATAAPLIQAAIAGKKMAGGTPTVAILQGLVAYLQANTTPGYKPVIVLATDGVPDATCLTTPDGGLPNSLANAETVAAAALAGTPSIPTFVIGVGSDLTPLNALAAAGGTGAATIIDVSGDGGSSEQAFINALNAIREQALTCNFDIPQNAAIDPSATNVTYTNGAGVTTDDVYVGDAASCSKAPLTGWYFDNPNNPKQVILCMGACDLAKTDPGASVNVVLGCPRNSIK